MTLLYQIPASLISAVNSGKAELFGAVIKEVTTGQILGHVQQTSALNSLMNWGVQGAGNLVSGGFLPLNALTVFQNLQIQKNLEKLQESAVFLQHLQIGNLALSGAGLGVSVVGFAMVLSRLKSIQSNLDKIHAKIDEVTNDRRNDALNTLFATIEADVNNVRYLSDHPNPATSADALQHNLIRSARELEGILKREIDLKGKDSLPIEQLERLWALIAALRICQEAAIHALFYADHLNIAVKLAHDEAERLVKLLSQVTPDELSRLVARREQDWEKSITLRQKAFQQANLLTQGMMGSTIAMAGQSSLAQTLVDNGESGRAFLDAAQAESQQPLLFVSPNT